MSGENKYESVLEKKEILLVLEKRLKKEFRLQEYSIKLFSESLMGFLGDHFRMMATVSVEDRTETFRYFIKRMPTAVHEHREYAIKTKAFYKEVELYKSLFADLKSAQINVENSTNWCPEYYYSRGSELFVLEDLSSKGYYMYPERSYLDEDHIEASLRAMAAMHAASVVFEEKFNAGEVATLSPEFKHVPGKKVTLGEIYSYLTFETEASDVKGHPGNTYHEAGIPSQVKIVEFLSEYSEDEKQIIKTKLPDVMRRFLQLVKTSTRFKNVFLHGDLWANNLLFRKDRTGKVEKALIIDFQLARYAPPAHDIMMFLHLVQSKKFREDHQHRLLEYYYAAFAMELEKNSLRADALLPKDTFFESCDFYDQLGLISKLFYFQLILAPPEITGKFLSTPELFTKTMLTDRTEMVVECFLTDEICRSRVTEALTDVIKKFILN